MSVNYSMSIGYGIAIPSEEVPAALGEFESPYEDGGIPEWLEENGFSDIGYDYCGDWMSGQQVYFFYVKETALTNVDIAYMDDVIYDFSTSVSVEQQEQLEKLAFILLAGGQSTSIGWKLIANIS